MQAVAFYRSRRAVGSVIVVLDRQDPNKTLSIQVALARMMPSQVVGKPIREVIDLLGWVGLDTTGLYEVLRDRLAEHLREVKHLARLVMTVSELFLSIDARKKEKKKVAKAISRL
jgi:hypothetical protein